MRVLCVEDEVALREDIAEYLRMKSYEVDEAGSGVEAMLQLRKQHYDLVLCDIKMPNMDGYELLSEVRRENTLTTTPFLFLSALTEKDDKIRAHSGGVDAYLTKPVDFNVLDATVRAHIERQRAREFIASSTIDATKQHMMSLINDALAGPLAEASELVEFLRTTVPVLTPSGLDGHLATIQTRIDGHVLDLHMFHHALQLQTAQEECSSEAMLVEDLIRLAMEECSHHCPAMPVRYKAGELNGATLYGDKRMLQRALAGLLAAVPTAQETKDIVTCHVADAEVTLTIADEPDMLKDDGFMEIDATTNLAQLATVTRKRLVPLTHAVQVAQAHHGRLEILLWPEDRLAVRFTLPQLKK